MTNSEIAIIIEEHQKAFLALQSQILLIVNAGALKGESMEAFENKANEALDALERIKRLIDGVSPGEGASDA